MKQCRECNREVSEQAYACPQCGAPYPSRVKWDGWGYEYRSKTTLFGIPLLHVSFKYSPGRRPVPAKGIVAIGQFACGVFTLSQFGIGLVSVSQFTLAGIAVAQFAAAGAALAQIGVAYSLVAQFGLYFHEGHGQMVRGVCQLLGAN